MLPDGTSYRMLVLPDVGLMPYARTMTPGLLKRIAELAEAGATIVGPPPLRSPSLEDYPRCDGQIDRLVKHLWADCDGKTATEHRVGNGRVIWGKTPQEVLAGMGVPPDFVGGSVTSPPVRYCHRRLEDGTDIYFVANKERDAREITCGFRVADKRPEFWWPQTGRIEPAAVYDKVEGTSNVALRLEEDESVFVVFRPEARPQPNRITAIVRDGTTIVDTSRGRVRTTTTPQSGAPQSLLSTRRS